MKRLPLLGLALLVSFAACGGSDPTPEDEVTDVARQIIEAKEPEQVETVCRELVTPGFLDEVYGGKVEACIEQPVSDEVSSDLEGEMTVDSVEVDGENAAVEVLTEGGPLDGSGGTWTMTEAGGEWKLDRFEDDYVRSGFTASVGAVDDGVMSYEPMRKCMSGQIEKLPSKQLRSMTFQILSGEKDKAMKSVLTVAERCPKPMAEFVADELATRVVGAEGGSPAQVRCARRNLVPLLQLTGLSSMALNSGSDAITGAALAGLIRGALEDCPTS